MVVVLGGVVWSGQWVWTVASAVGEHIRVAGGQRKNKKGTNKWETENKNNE